MELIIYPFCLQAVEGMKVVCHELAQATADPEGSTMDDIVKDADRLVSCLANKAIILLFSLVFLLGIIYGDPHKCFWFLQVAKTFDFSLTGASSRSCKYVLNTLMQVGAVLELTNQSRLTF